MCQVGHGAIWKNMALIERLMQYGQSKWVDAFCQRGQVRGMTLHQNLAQADAGLRNMQKLGIDLDAITEKMRADGVAAFSASLNKLPTTLVVSVGPEPAPWPDY